MREVLGFLILLILIILLFAYSGDEESMDLVQRVWSMILQAVRDLGEAWRASK